MLTMRHEKWRVNATSASRLAVRQPGKAGISTLTQTIAACLCAASTIMLDASPPQQQPPAALSLTQLLLSQGCSASTLPQNDKASHFVCHIDADSTARCDAPDLEPIDIPMPPACAQPLSIRDAVVFETENSELRGPLAVDWLSLSAEGQVRVVASRIYSSSAPPKILVDTSRERLLRISRPPFSPITLDSTTLSANGKIDLPPARDGGELALLSTAAAVMPRSYRIVGWLNADIARGDRRLVSQAGLQPAQYELTPIYSDGLPGLPRLFTIESGRSSLVLMPPDPVGRAVITAAADICYNSPQLEIRPTPLGSQLQGFIRDGNKLTVSARSQCTWTVEGLRAGRYFATAYVPVGSAGTAGFAITGQGTTHVALPSVQLHVSGHVSQNARALSGANVLLTSEVSGESVYAVTDSEGWYRLQVSTPGDYRAIVSSANGQLSKGFTLRNMEETIDFAIPAGSIIVHVENWNGTEPVIVQVVSQTLSKSEAILPGQPPRLAVNGLRPDTYTLSASAGNNYASKEAVVVALTTDTPAADITLSLRLDDRRLIVVDEAGAPVDVSSVPRLTRVAPGTYSINALQTGTSLRIVAPLPYSPTCRVTSQDDLLAILRAGRLLTLELPLTTQMTVRSGRFTSFPDTACPVPLTSLSFDETVDGSIRRYQFMNFPRGNVVVQIGTHEYNVTDDVNLLRAEAK